MGFLERMNRQIFFEGSGILQGRDDVRIILRITKDFLPSWQAGKEIGVGEGSLHAMHAGREKSQRCWRCLTHNYRVWNNLCIMVSTPNPDAALDWWEICGWGKKNPSFSSVEIIVWELWAGRQYTHNDFLPGCRGDREDIEWQPNLLCY